MTGGLTDEQALLRETVSQVAADLRADPLALTEQRASREGWELLVELGLPAMRFPAEVGGSDATAVDVAIVAEALAQAPSVCPFLGPVLAAELLVRGGSRADLQRGFAEGDAPLTLALEHDLSFLAGVNATSAIAWDAPRSADAVGLVADELVIRSAGDEEIPSADLTRRVESLPDDGGEAIGEITPQSRTGWHALALTLLAADLIGTMQGALELAVQYARERKQFGRPIGTFQSLQHMLADANVSVGAARSAVNHAAWAVDTMPPDEALVAARVAKAYAARVAVEVTETAMQVHGAMGVTWESLCHLFVRRAVFDSATLGGESAQLTAIAELRLGTTDGHP